MKREIMFYPLLAFALLALAILACGSETKGEKVGETTEDETESEQAAPELEVFRIGDIVKVSDHTIVLNSAGIEGGSLIANFTIENQGTNDLNVSTMVNFEARSGDGTTLDEDIFDCDSDIGGKILPGDKMKGNVCWENATSPVKIYY